MNTEQTSKNIFTYMKVFKYLSVKIYTNLTWKDHANDLSIKLNRANTLLFKMRKYVNLKILGPIYFANFDPCLCCLGSKF